MGGSGIVAITQALMKEMKSPKQEVYKCVEVDLELYVGIRRYFIISQPGYLEDLREESGINKPREPESETNTQLNPAGIKMLQSMVGSSL